MFDTYAPEVRRFARTKLADLEPSREARMLCGVITGVRTQMTQRGKILIVSLDDKTAVVEVTVYSEVFEANKNIFKEDEFLLVVGKVSEDRFNGGLRITAEKCST
jgi:DNA polymerase-3 subunit alpha